MARKLIIVGLMVITTLMNSSFGSALILQGGEKAPGTRLCSAMGALVWVLEDEKHTEWSICEFKDGSALLTDDLGKVIQKFQQ